MDRRTIADFETKLNSLPDDSRLVRIIDEWIANSIEAAPDDTTRRVDRSISTKDRKWLNANCAFIGRRISTEPANLEEEVHEVFPADVPGYGTQQERDERMCVFYFLQMLQWSATKRALHKDKLPPRLLRCLWPGCQAPARPRLCMDSATGGASRETCSNKCRQAAQRAVDGELSDQLRAEVEAKQPDADEAVLGAAKLGLCALWANRVAFAINAKQFFDDRVGIEAGLAAARFAANPKFPIDVADVSVGGPICDQYGIGRALYPPDSKTHVSPTYLQLIAAGYGVIYASRKYQAHIDPEKQGSLDPDKIATGATKAWASPSIDIVVTPSQLAALADRVQGGASPEELQKDWEEISLEVLGARRKGRK